MSARFTPTRPCRNGHTADRYRRSGACVECVKEAGERYRKRGRSSAAFLAETIQRGLPIPPALMRRVAARFEGGPCRRCGGTERYRSTGACVACARRKSGEKSS